MELTRRISFLFAVGVFITGLTGCGTPGTGPSDQLGAAPAPTSQRPASAPPATEVPRATPLSAAPTSTLPQASVYAECGWTRMARAWEDRNANGQWEDDEPPLVGVTIVVSGTIDTRPYKFDAVTDAQGQAPLTMVFAGCPTATAKVSTTPPPGYVSTTPSQFVSDVRKYYTDETIQFGFKKK